MLAAPLLSTVAVRPKKSAAAAPAATHCRCAHEAYHGGQGQSPHSEERLERPIAYTLASAMASLAWSGALARTGFQADARLALRAH